LTTIKEQKSHAFLLIVPLADGRCQEDKASGRGKTEKGMDFLRSIILIVASIF
jgi:hypothetical protein